VFAVPAASTLFPEGKISGFLPPALSTGSSDLDRKFRGGLRPGDSVLFEGDPGTGKSTMANQIAHRMADEGAAVLWYAFEDSPRQLLAYMTARQAGINSVAIALDVYRSSGDREAAEEAYQILVHGREGEGGILKRIHFGETESLDDLRRQVEAFAAHYPDRPKVLGIDPLHALPVASEQEVERVSRAMNLIRDLTKQHGLTALCTAHMNAAGQARGNYGLGHTFSIVLHLEPDESVKSTFLDDLEPIVVLTVKKSKNGETGRIRYRFQKWANRFVGLAREIRP
jgi:KaiC/GvpD/RAD55 family RecA-like ATPase